jgi:hypothetical protein
MLPTVKPTGNHGNAALMILQCTVGLVVMVQALLLALDAGAARAFAHTGLHDAFRHLLAWSEVAGAVLFLVPRSRWLGGWCLLIIFAAAALLHLSRGQWNIGSLLVYAAAVIVILAHHDRSFSNLPSGQTEGENP